MKTVLVIIGLVVYFAIGALTDRYLNNGHFEWTSIPIMYMWPLVMFLLFMIIIVKDFRKKGDED